MESLHTFKVNNCDVLSENALAFFKFLMSCISYPPLPHRHHNNTGWSKKQKGIMGESVLRNRTIVQSAVQFLAGSMSKVKV